MPVAWITSGHQQVPLYYYLSGGQAGANGKTFLGSPPQRVLMISGLGIRNDSAWFKHIVDHLASLRDVAGAPVACVCTHDPRGVGGSYTPWDLREYTSVRMAQDALGLLDYLGWERAHILGASLGAQAASKLAAMAPHRVCTLTLLGCSRTGLQNMKSALLYAPLRAHAMLLGQVWHRSCCWGILHHFFSKDFLRQEVVVKGTKQTRYDVLVKNSFETLRPNLGQDRSQTAVGRLGHCLAVASHRLSVDEAAVIREGGFPVIQVHGNRDGASALTYGIELCQHLHSTMLVLEGAHAGITIEKAAQLLAALELVVLGRECSTQAQRQAVQEQAIATIMTSSFAYWENEVLELVKGLLLVTAAAVLRWLQWLLHLVAPRLS